MRSKTSYFDFVLFRKTLIRFWPIWFAYAFIWLTVLPLQVGSNLARILSYPGNGFSDVMYTVQYSPLAAACGGGMAITFIFSCISAMCVFSHLYSSRASGAYAVLPIRREGAFFSVALAGILPLLIVNVLVFLITALIEAVSGALFLPALLSWLGSISLMLIAFFGIAALCAQLTGNIIVLPLLYLVLNFAAVVIEYLAKSLLSSYVFGFSGQNYILSFLSPLIELANNCNAVPLFGKGVELHVTGYSFEGWGTLLCYAAVGILTLVCALLHYRKRRMETAGDVVAVNCLKPVFKYCMAVGCALVIGSILLTIVFDGSIFWGYVTVVDSSGTIYLILFMMLGAFLGYFASEMLIHKSFAVFRGGKRWLGLGVVCVLCVVAVLSWEYDMFGYERRVPETSEIQKIELRTAGNILTLERADDIALATELHQNIISHKAIHEASSESVAKATLIAGRDADRISQAYASVWFKYTLKNGTVLSREYSLSGWTTSDGQASDSIGDLYALQSLINQKHHIEDRMLLDFELLAKNVSYASIEYHSFGQTIDPSWMHKALTASEAVELYYDCIVPDIKDGNMGKISIINNEKYDSAVYSCDISLGIYTEDRDGNYIYDSFYFTPTVDSARTNAWLLEHGVDLVTLADVYDSHTQYDDIVAATAGR